ncbi:MAG: hypothetical protein HY808_09060 [Nitrospirae bacterium]|nr:hypothetical protein [Nitrospirota bacterium]
MNKIKFLILMGLLLAATAFYLGADQGHAQPQPAAEEPLSDFLAGAKGKVKPSEIKAVAARMAAAKAAKTRTAAEGQNNHNQPSAPAPDAATVNSTGGETK